MIFVISHNNTLLAIHNLILDDKGDTINMELVIADASGERLKSIPWEENWRSLLGWKDDQHVLLSVDFDRNRNNYSLLEIDPFNDERQRIQLTNIAPGWDEYIKTHAPTAYGLALLLCFWIPHTPCRFILKILKRIQRTIPIVFGI